MPHPPVTTMVSELFGISTAKGNSKEWQEVIQSQQCPYLGRRCLKVRKSQPEISIGTCTVRHGKERASVIICPFRLLERLVG